MKKHILIITALGFFVISGCGSTLKQQWYNFNAYYNTFYNANQYFDRGLEANRNQRAEINPNELIRIHPPPTTAGFDYFEQSIVKSSDILRRHSQSKYVDDALLLIGASFFYRQEFFSALEKFQELYAQTGSSSMRSRATIWEGRTYLELESYGEGIRFMESRIANTSEWASRDLAEARAVLAQLYAYRGDLMPAGNQLLLALEDLHGDSLRSRAFFHYGQLMERLNNMPQAGYAFAEVQSMRPSFDLEYNARLRSIDIIRKMGNLEEAARELRVMSRNNKFFDYRLEVLHELAQTERMKGNISQAEDLFNRVIHSSTETPGQALVARSYYQLADLYRNEKSDYRTAAAYYDSASVVQISRENLPEWWDANEMARTFGEFAEVKTELSHIDSLLMLARLSPEEFEERIAEIEARQRLQIQQEQQERERMTGAQVVTAPEEEIISTTETDIDRHGFLNVHNRVLLNQSSLQFRSVWGDRPLADDWRRQQAVTGSRGDFENQRVIVEPDAIEPDRETIQDEQIQLDISEIPFSPSRQAEMEERRYMLFHQLGNVFLLTLNLPDSAKIYFEKVALEAPESAPKPASMYALLDIFFEEGRDTEAMRWAELLIENYPESSHARLASSRTGLQLPVRADQLLSVDREFILMDDERRAVFEAQERVQRLESMAAATDESQEAARLLYDAAREYIREARAGTMYNEKQRQWQLILQTAENHPELQPLIESETDSVEVDHDFMNAIGIDSDILTSEIIADVYPYNGPLWDEARALLLDITENYGDTDTANRAGILLQEIDSFRLPADSSMSLDER